MSDGTHSILRKLTNMQGVQSSKRLSLSRTEDGTVTMSVVALKDDITAMMNVVKSYGSGIVKVSSIKAEGAFSTISIVIRSEQDSVLKVRKTLLFKSIPKNIADMYDHFMFPKSMVPTHSEPDVQIKVKKTENNADGTSEMFGATGWTISSIFKELGIELEIASVLDYHVYELHAKQGSPIVGLLQSLLPIPGIIITQYANKFYVNIVDTNEPSIPVGKVCFMLGRSTNFWEYIGVVTGLTAEPRNIVGLDTQETDLYKEYAAGGFLDSYFSSSGEHNVQLNLVGGIYGVTKTRYTDADMTAYVQEMFRITSTEGY